MLFVAWVAYNGIDRTSILDPDRSNDRTALGIPITRTEPDSFEVMAQLNDSSDQPEGRIRTRISFTGLMGNNIAFWATMALNIP